jgi:hypothetical protein
MKVNAIIKAVKDKKDFHLKKKEIIDYILLEPLAYSELEKELEKDVRLRRVSYKEGHIYILDTLVIKDINPTDYWLKVVKK